MEKLYHSKESQSIIKEWALKGTSHDTDTFSVEATEMALLRLKTGKATGMDALPDRFFKALKDQDILILHRCLQALRTTTNWPRYLYTAKQCFISKTSSEFPPIEKIREISILPATTKLIELLITR